MRMQRLRVFKTKQGKYFNHIVAKNISELLDRLISSISKILTLTLDCLVNTLN